MEFLSLHSPPVSPLPSSLRRAPMEKSFFLSGGQTLTFPRNIKRYPDARNIRFMGSIPRDTRYIKGAIGSYSKTTKDAKQKINSKDKDLVFVAGATGKVGSRTVRELLRLGFRVRAGVRSTQRAEMLSVQQMKLDDSAASVVRPVEKLEIVECDLENQGEIGPAMGNASIVICSIGASEKEVFDVTGPYRIDYKATKNLIDAATAARVDHFILLTSLGTNKIGFPAAILNLFWGVLFWKRKAEEALIASGLPYTIVRPGGMERPTDAYKETHNIILANEDTYFGGQVSNLQVAELMAFMAKNRSLSFCKVVEVIAETTAPLTPMEELLARIPSQRVDSSLFDESQNKTKSDPPTDPNTLSEPSSYVVDEEPIQVDVQTMKPLSPYSVYDDLKPPTSPSPTPSTTPNSPIHVNLVSEPGRAPLSETNTGNGTTNSSPALVSDKEVPQVPTQNSTHHSPYRVYDDLKPPTSPSPNAPTTIQFADSNFKISSTVTSSISQSPAADESRDEEHYKQQKPGPLSPYTMYEDLKPPTSPIPSVPKY